MDIYGISGAATFAITSTLAFVLVARSWSSVTRNVTVRRTYDDGIMHEAAQRFRGEFERLTQVQSIYLGAGLVFLVLFTTAYVLDAERLFLGYPLWELYILLVGLLACALLFAHQLLRTSMERSHIRLLRDANIAVGHHVQRIAADFGRAYHDIETTAGIIDHVIVSTSGVYAISVVASRPIANGTTSLNGTDLLFEPEGKPVSMVTAAAANAGLEREFRRLLDHRVRVRSVIVVPGWKISGQTGDEHLLVNEETLPMLRGWNDKNDHLMNEDVDALHRMLSCRCSLVGRQLASELSV